MIIFPKSDFVKKECFHKNTKIQKPLGVFLVKNIFEHVREMFYVFEHFFYEHFTNIFLIWTEHFSCQVFSSKMED